MRRSSRRADRCDPRDQATNASRGKSYSDYTKFLDKDGLRGMRLGVARKHFGFNDRVDKLMNDLLTEMKKLGAMLGRSGRYSDLRKV